GHGGRPGRGPKGISQTRPDQRISGPSQQVAVHQPERGGGPDGLDVEVAVEPDRDPDVPDAGGQGEERDGTQGAEGNRPDETDPLRARGGRPTLLAGRGERRWRIGPRPSG